MNQDPEITLGMIQNAIVVIDTCTARGAFRGEELLTIGTLRQQFADFYEWRSKQSADVEDEADKA